MSKAQDTEIDDGLTAEERAALAEEIGDERTTAHMDALEQQEAKEDEPKPQAQETTAAAADDATKPADEPAAVEDQPQPQPILVAQVSEGAEARLTEIATAKDALLEKFDSGDLTAREYQKELDGLNKQEREVEYELREAKLAEKLNTQRQQNEWVQTCNAFVAENAIYKDNPRLYRALDAEVRELAAKEETKNWSGQRFLQEAHKNLQQAFGFKDTAKPQAKPERNLPPNLAKVPAADVEDTSGNRFAVLDRMSNTDPLGFEEALSKMSQADRDAYLASA